MDKKRLKYLILYHVNSAKYLLAILALIMGINLALGSSSKMCKIR